MHLTIGKRSMGRGLKPFSVQPLPSGKHGDYKFKVIVNHNHIRRWRLVKNLDNLEQVKQSIIDKIESNISKNDITIKKSIDHLFNYPAPLGFKNLKHAHSRESYAKLFQDFFGKDKSVKSLTSDDIQKLVDHLITVEEKSVSHINCVIAFASKFFRFNFEQGYIDEKPKCPKPLKKKSKKRRVIHQHEEEKILDYFEKIRNKHPKASLVFCLLRYTGIRWNELRGLTFADLDFKDLCIHIRGGESNTKNDTTRTVYMTDVLKDILLRDLDLSFHSSKDKSEYLIESTDSISKQREFGRLFQKAKAHVGITCDNLVVYSLRHTFATNLADKGVSPFIIKDVMGHKNIKTTERYVHMGRDYGDTIRRALNSSENSGKQIERSNKGDHTYAEESTPSFEPSYPG